MTFDEEMKKFIEDRVALIKKGDAKRHMYVNMFYPEQTKKKDAAFIKEEIDKIKSIHSKTLPYIKKLRELINDITERTEICAIYLIYGKIIQAFDSIFLLSAEGFNFEVMELCRSINESLDLIKLFHLDVSHQYLNDWFDGKIIDNKIAREAEHKLLTSGGIEAVDSGIIDPYDMITEIYRVFSKYTHCAYGAILDSVDVYHHNFDWNKYGGFHYMLHNMHEVESTMVSTVVTLKMTYQKLGFIPDFENLTKILTDFAGPMDASTLKDLLPKITKRENKPNNKIC